MAGLAFKIDLSIDGGSFVSNANFDLTGHPNLVYTVVAKEDWAEGTFEAEGQFYYNAQAKLQGYEPIRLYRGSGASRTQVIPRIFNKVASQNTYANLTTTQRVVFAKNQLEVIFGAGSVSILT